MCIGMQEVSKITNVLLAVNIITIICMVLVSMFDLSLINWTYDTTNNSSALPEFFDNYYSKTTGEEGVFVKDMDCANDGCLDDQKSFVQLYCENESYESLWYQKVDENSASKATNY